MIKSIESDALKYYKTFYAPKGLEYINLILNNKDHSNSFVKNRGASTVIFDNQDDELRGKDLYEAVVARPDAYKELLNTWFKTQLGEENIKPTFIDTINDAQSVANIINAPSLSNELGKYTNTCSTITENPELWDDVLDLNITDSIKYNIDNKLNINYLAGEVATVKSLANIMGYNYRDYLAYDFINENLEFKNNLFENDYSLTLLNIDNNYFKWNVLNNGINLNDYLNETPDFKLDPAVYKDPDIYTYRSLWKMYDYYMNTIDLKNSASVSSLTFPYTTGRFNTNAQTFCKPVLLPNHRYAYCYVRNTNNDYYPNIIICDSTTNEILHTFLGDSTNTYPSSAEVSSSWNHSSYYMYSPILIYCEQTDTIYMFYRCNNSSSFGHTTLGVITIDGTTGSFINKAVVDSISPNMTNLYAAAISYSWATSICNGKYCAFMYSNKIYIVDKNCNVHKTTCNTPTGVSSSVIYINGIQDIDEHTILCYTSSAGMSSKNHGCHAHLIDLDTFTVKSNVSVEEATTSKSVQDSIYAMSRPIYTDIKNKKAYFLNYFRYVYNNNSGTYYMTALAIYCVDYSDKSHITCRLVKSLESGGGSSAGSYWTNLESLFGICNIKNDMCAQVVNNPYLILPDYGWTRSDHSSIPVWKSGTNNLNMYDCRTGSLIKTFTYTTDYNNTSAFAYMYLHINTNNNNNISNLSYTDNSKLYDYISMSSYDSYAYHRMNKEV